MFDNSIQNGKSKIISSWRRQWGKTTILNEIGLCYQAIGYRVFLATDFSNSSNHYAEKLIDGNYAIREVPIDNIIVIIDEFDLCNNINYRLLRYLEYHDIMYVGFCN
jgi:hypothetical protein